MSNSNVELAKSLHPVLLVIAIGAAGCSGWSTPEVAPGPVPLGPPGHPIVRLKSERPTFEHTYINIFWDDGHGLQNEVDRAKTVTDAVPTALLDRLNVMRPDTTYAGTLYDRRNYDARVVLVSLNPDVVVVSLLERPHLRKDDPIRDAFYYWDQKDGRWQIIDKTLEKFGFWLDDFTLYAGSLVPWTDEMYVYSTDPRVRFERLGFVSGQTTVPLPNGKLVLRRRDIDVDVSRE